MDFKLYLIGSNHNLLEEEFVKNILLTKNKSVLYEGGEYLLDKHERSILLDDDLFYVATILSMIQIKQEINNIDNIQMQNEEIKSRLKVVPKSLKDLIEIGNKAKKDLMQNYDKAMKTLEVSSKYNKLLRNEIIECDDNLKICFIKYIKKVGKKLEPIYQEYGFSLRDYLNKLVDDVEKDREVSSFYIVNLRNMTFTIKILSFKGEELYVIMGKEHIDGVIDLIKDRVNMKIEKYRLPEDALIFD
jgi:hypothetical protein